MKKYIALGLLCILGIASLSAQTRSFKRGISYNIPVAGDVQILSKGLMWYYNWAHTPPADPDILEAIEKYKLDFIPMAWNGVNKEQLRAFYSRNPQIKYILGFNEPNFTAQANMPPSVAAAKWHEIEEIADEFGLKIVGPAMNYAPSNGAVKENDKTYTDPFEYLDDFFAACPDCRVDYIAAHCYMNYASAMEWYIEQYKKYGKPIWLTEFCAWENGVTPEIQKKYVVEAINYLESDPDVHRYAWFIGRSGTTGSYPYMQLLGKREGELTEIGEIYVNMSSFDKESYYTLNDTIPASDYIDVSGGIHLQKSTDVSGILNLTDFYSSYWTAYNIEIPHDGAYKLKFRVATQFAGELSFSVNGHNLLTESIDATGGLDQWQTKEATINLKQGKQVLRIDSNSGRVNFNWFLVMDNLAGINNQVSSDLLKIYPNPVESSLYIESASAMDYFLTLTDMAGKVLYQIPLSNSIDMSGFPAGMYLLEAEPPRGERIIKKVIKK